MKKLLCCCLLLISCTLNAKVFERIVTFGDSLSDTGNLYEYMMHLLPKSPPYYKGHFSNGPVWTENVFAHYFLSASHEHDNNYAAGGAAAVIDGTNTLPFSLGTEVEDYLYLHEDHKKDSTLFLVWIGGNNYINFPGHVEETTTKAVNAIERNLSSLIHHGAEIFFVPNLPDLGAIPKANSNANHSAQLSALTIAHNKKLKAMLEKMKTAHPNVMFIEFDAKSIWDDVVEHPENYGISNTRDACYDGSIILLKTEPNDDMLRASMMREASLNGVSVSPQRIEMILNTPVLREVAKTSWRLNQNLVHDSLDCTGYLFWDDVHPTTYVHQKIAEYAIKALEESGLEFERHFEASS